MTRKDLLKLSDYELSKYLENVSLEDFRTMLDPPKPQWTADNDGLQWIVRRDGKIVGYYPRFDQAVRRIYEGMVADGVEVIDDIKQAVQVAFTVYEKVKLVGR